MHYTFSAFAAPACHFGVVGFPTDPVHLPKCWIYLYGRPEQLKSHCFFVCPYAFSMGFALLYLILLCDGNKKFINWVR